MLLIFSSYLRLAFYQKEENARIDLNRAPYLNRFTVYNCSMARSARGNGNCLLFVIIRKNKFEFLSNMNENRHSSLPRSLFF